MKGTQENRQAQEQMKQQKDHVQLVKYNIDNLQHPSVRALYRKRLNKKLGESRHGDTEQQYQFFEDCIHSAAMEALDILLTMEK